jgi:hypothetical protein
VIPKDLSRKVVKNKRLRRAFAALLPIACRATRGKLSSRNALQARFFMQFQSSDFAKITGTACGFLFWPADSQNDQ